MENRSAPPGAVVPVLRYNDVGKAIEWLSGAFGFIERLRTAPEADGTIHHAQVAAGGGSVILTGRTAEQRSSSSSSAHGLSQGIYVQVKDVDRHFEQARQFGARIVSEPRTCEFGERQYSAQDLEGYCWTFSQSVADVAPEEWGAAVDQLYGWLEGLPSPRLCYLEMPAADVHQSAAFYERVLEWNVRHRDSPRPSFDDPSGVSGAWVVGRKISTEPGLLLYIWVDSIEDTLSKIAANGGEIVAAPHPDSPGSASRIATFRDPAGNLIGLHQPGS